MAAGVPLPLFAKARRYVDRARLTEPERMTAHSLLRVIPIASLFAPEFLSSLAPDYAPYQMLGRHYDRALAEAPLDRELYADLKLTISDNDVPKVVRMTEAAGVTVRFPFLDARFAELAVSIPAREKLKGRELRVFFKRAYADLLPPETIRKKKHGFGLPIPIWLRTDPTLAGMLREALFAPTSRIRPWFREGALEDLHARHQTDTTSFYGTVLWNLLVLDQWLRTHS
jgi:asparagine synthase (glutamine-hydrolysing)